MLDYRSNTWHMIFIDFKQTYDSVERQKMSDAMRGSEISDQYMHLVQMALQETDHNVKVDGNVSNKCNVCRDLKQGNSFV